MDQHNDGAHLHHIDGIAHQQQDNGSHMVQHNLQKVLTQEIYMTTLHVNYSAD